MIMSSIRPADRRAFTLIEVMIAIVIVAALAAILLVAVGPILLKGPEMQARNDINQLGIALENFKSQYGFYPLSQVVICDTTAGYQALLAAATSPQQQMLIQDSQYYMTKMFPRAWQNPHPNAAQPQWVGIDWNGNGLPDNGGVVLTGDQCLVFFLGGMQSGNTVNGFASNPNDPTAVATAATVIGPFFEFKTERLQAKANGFLTYMDAYKTQPYAYFSSGRSRNNYNRYGVSDCAVLGVWPYASQANAAGVPTNYLNPNSYQVICAGKDGVFGVGSALPGSQGGYLWSPTTTDKFPPKIPGGLGDGRDDISNFYEGKLGS